MRTFLTLSVMVAGLTLASCGGTATATGPVGSWVVDRSQTQPQIEKMMAEKAGMPGATMDDLYAKMPEAARDMVKEQVDNMWKMIGSVKAKLDADNTYEMRFTEEDGKAKVRTGKWSINGENVTFTPDDKDHTGDVPDSVLFRNGMLELSGKGMPITVFMTRG